VSLILRKAPIGWWLKGFKNRTVAHIWEGNDGLFHAFTFPPDCAPVARGPWKFKEEAISAVTLILEPPRKPGATNGKP
jgi:hypothetical protein